MFLIPFQVTTFRLRATALGNNLAIVFADVEPPAKAIVKLLNIEMHVYFPSVCMNPT